MLLSDIFLLVITFFFLFLIVRLLFSIENIKYLSNKILLLIFLILGFGFCRYFVINRVQDFYNLQLPLIVVANSTIPLFLNLDMAYFFESDTGQRIY